MSHWNQLWIDKCFCIFEQHEREREKGEGGERKLEREKASDNASIMITEIKISSRRDFSLRLCMRKKNLRNIRNGNRTISFFLYNNNSNILKSFFILHKSNVTVEEMCDH